MTVFGFQARMLASMALASAVFSAIAADLPVPPAGLTVPSKQFQIPAFNLSTPDGGTLRANELRDKVVIARFWATW